jgi:AcrR family transcriptional regulator
VPTRLSPSANQSGEETRAKIIAATLITLREDGIVGTTARAIARRGGFNQALIFYHFGGVTGLLVAAATAEGVTRSQRYAPRLESVTTLRELVAVARELHDEQAAEGTLTQLLAGAASSSELREGLMAAFRPWMGLVEDAVARVLHATPYADLFNAKDLAFAIASLFLGVELLNTLDPEPTAGPSLFATFEQMATLVEAILNAVPPPAPATRSR